MIGECGRGISWRSRLCVGGALVLALVCALPFTAPAASGGPDRTFGGQGLFAARFADSYLTSSFESVEATADGGALMWQWGPNGRLGPARYSPGGSIEAVAGSSERQPLKATQPDGKTIEVDPGGYRERAKFRRRLPDGAPDPSFGVGGEELLPFFAEAATKDHPWTEQTRPESLIVLPSGKLVLVGRAIFNQVVDARTLTTEYELALLRLEADGQPDRSFGADGFLATRTDLGIPAQRSLEFGGVAPTPGEGLVVGIRNLEKGSAVLALTPGGGREQSFGSDGVAAVRGTSVDVHATADGKVLVAGWDTRRTGTGPYLGDFYVSRLGSNGLPDPSFGASGTTQIDLGGDDRLNTALWETDGSVLLGGVSASSEPLCQQAGLCTEEPALARIDANGGIDPGFGAGGVLRLGSLASPGAKLTGSGVLALASRPGGGAYAAGGIGTTAFVAAFDHAGRPVPGFGDGGVAVDLYPRPSRSSIADVAVDSGHGVLVVGSTNSGNEEEAQERGFALRLGPGGSPDPDYGGGEEFVALPPEPRKLVLDHGGALVLFEHSILRLTGSGEIDRSFGSGGVLTPAPPKKFAELDLKAIDALPSGKILVAGAVGFVQERIAVYRFRADGSPDPSFGHRGARVLPIGNETKPWFRSRCEANRTGACSSAATSNT